VGGCRQAAAAGIKSTREFRFAAGRIILAQLGGVTGVPLPPHNARMHAGSETTPVTPRTVRGTLIVFARRPLPGHCKRRLARAVGPGRAARLYAATLARTLAEVERVANARRVLLTVTAADAAWFRVVLRGRGWHVGRQATGDLGRRMERALRAATGHARYALLIGSDMLDVDAADLAAARVALLAGHDVVLGPAADGGYWLIGVRRPCPVLFDDMPWGGDTVCSATRARAAAAGLTLAEVALRHDLDRGRDLVRRHPRRFQRRRARSRLSSAT